MQVIINNKGKHRLLSGHPWIFRSDLQVKENPPAGIVAVEDSKGHILGQAFYSPHSQIALRIITRKKEKIPENFWKEKIKHAAQFREKLNIPSNAYRVVFGESDGIPSFVLDRYDNAFSFQLLSAGAETEREALLKAVEEIFHPKLLVERNDVSVRNLEKLPLSAQVLKGDENVEMQIQEGELKFEVNLLEGQKTGAFLDQRHNRLETAKLAKGKKRVLDTFSYQGWFACPMAKGAQETIAVEQSDAACKQIARNAAFNQIDRLNIVTANVFDYLKEADQRKERFDLINLDPPAFVKSRSQLGQALKGYKEINLRALKLLEPNGVLVTSSCSHHLSEEEFIDVVTDAALDAQRQVQIFKKGQQDVDHPILLGFPESNYLKCLFLRVL